MARRGRWLTVALAAALSAVLAAHPHTARAEDEDEVVVRGGAGNFASRATIATSPREVTDAASLVEPLPGVHVRRLGADDSFATLSIRGSTSTQVAVYLAGVPLSGGADPTLDLATLPLWPGARATVHRTFAPAALGRGSLGGTLTIDPPSPRTEEQTEVWAAAGSFGSRRLRVGDVRAAGDVRFATGLSASRSDDDFTYFDPSTHHDVTRLNAGHTAVAGLESVAIPAGHGALTITTLAQARRQELPGSTLYRTPFQRLDSTRLLEALELTQPAGNGTAGVRAWVRREGLSIHDTPDTHVRTFGQPYRTDDVIVAAGGSTGWKGRIGGRGALDAGTLELRLDGSGERFSPGTWLGGTSPPGAIRANAGVAVDAMLPLSRFLIVSGSARGDAWIDRSEGSASTPAGPATGRPAAVHDTELRPTAHAGVEAPLGSFVLASHAGWVTRPPSFVERYGNRGAFVNAPGLRPESAFTTDAGLRWSGRSGTGREALTIRTELAGFATWADDLITYVYQGAQRFALATNIGEARIYGLEGEVRGGAYGLDLRVAYTGLLTANDSTCRTTPAGCERPRLLGRPAHDLVADLAYELGPVRLRYGLDFVSGIVLDDHANIEVPARVLHGASVRVNVPQARGLSLTLDVRNLFDLRTGDYVGIGGSRDTQPIGDLYDYPLPGRRVLLSARYSTR